MKTIAIIQARMGSQRFPGKVMKDLDGMPVVMWAYLAASDAKGIDEVVIATSTLEQDNAIADWCADNRIECFRGSESDVLDRFQACANVYGADVILRLTGDCPFLDSRIITEVIQLRAMTGADYATNTDPPTYPDGLDVECFTWAALEVAHQEATRPSDRDCVTQYISRNRYRFKAANLTCPLPGLHKERWVLDTEEDYEFCKAIASRLGGGTVTYTEILRILDKEPELRKLNERWTRNERFYQALACEDQPRRTYARSDRLLDRALQTIPFGSQTFSKSHIQFPGGRAPLYVTHADGSHIYDVDGNDYVDLVNAVLPVVLGYRDPDVDAAIRDQLNRGISFSLASDREVELSELLCRLIPCAEMVKFGKSGTDVTTAAIRLARAYTGKEHIMLSGYHGWADWSMARTNRNKGIPIDVWKLSHRMPYGEKVFFSNDINWPDKNDVAAVIVEPNDNPEYLKWLREECTKQGALLIFDEIITGFRYSLGGAQKFFGVTPDLACFGKAMGNGMPISALVGRRDIMKMCEPPNNIFYSGTFFGETLSIAAAIATINKMERENVTEYLFDAGQHLSDRVETLIDNAGLHELIRVSGHYSRRTLDFKDDKIRTLFMIEMIQNGVLIINSHNMSYAIKKPEIDRIRIAYENSLVAVKEAQISGAIDDLVKGAVVTAAPLRATS
jgi:glutamate-1-semialdehyde 2,1-aminomutase/spore coat polysaccharide biosynthesis protein SpsF